MSYPNYANLQDLDGLRPFATTPLPKGLTVADDILENLPSDVARVLSGGAVTRSCFLRMRRGTRTAEWFDRVVRLHTRGLRTMDLPDLAAMRRGRHVVSVVDNRHYVASREHVRSGCTTLPLRKAAAALEALRPVLRRGRAGRRPAVVQLGRCPDHGYACLRMFRNGDDLRVRLDTGPYATDLGTPAQAARHLRLALSMRPKR